METKNKHINLRVKNSLYEKLAELAAKKGVSISEIIREKLTNI